MLVALIVTVSLVSAEAGKQALVSEFKQAIKDYKYKQVGNFYFFKDKKNQSYISTKNLREVSDITIAGGQQERRKDDKL